MARVSTLSRAALGSVLILVRLVNGLEDLVIYQNDALGSGWENWSWNSEINFGATDLYAGESGTSMSVKSSEWAALSLKHADAFTSYAGLRFDIAVSVFASSPVEILRLTGLAGIPTWASNQLPVDD
jgi:hypothetical protein